MINDAGQETLPARKRRGPPPTGKGVQIGVRLQPDELKKLDAFAISAGFDISRPEAIRLILREKLK